MAANIPQHGQRNANDRKVLDSAAIVEVLRTPGLRLGDVAGIEMLAGQLVQQPDDPYLQDVLGHVVEEQAALELAANDPFHGNAPPVGTLPAFVPGRAPVLQLPSGEVLTLDLLRAPQNLVLVGPTGTGKTTWLRLFLLSALAAPPCLVLAFDRKRGELVDCASLAQAGLPLLVLHWRELKLALLQPPRGVGVQGFGNTLVNLLAKESHLFASRRLMLDTLERLYGGSRARGTWPTFAAWLDMIERIRVSATSRLGQYKEAAYFAMRQVLIELGEVVNYTASDMLERLLARCGAVVVITEGLSSTVQGLLVSVFLNYAFLARQRAADFTTLAPLYCVIDDALPLAYGSAAAEAEGGLNALSEWCFMGRSRRMALLVSAQNFALLSPALRANCHVTVCLGSYGRDADEVAQHMSLTREQAERLPFLRPGEAVARMPPWPAVYGRVPEVP